MTTSSTAVHGPVGRQVQALVDAVDALLTADVEALLCSGEVAALTAVQAKLDAALLDRVQSVNASLAWTADGSRSCGAWLARRTRHSRTDAGATVKLAAQLTDRPLVAGALRDGLITRRHARELCHWFAKLQAYLIGTSRYDLPLLLAEQEAAFLTVALLTDPHTLAVELKKRVQAFAPAPADRDAERVEADRRASLLPGFDGGWDLRAELGELAGQTLSAALAAYRRGDHSSGDTRTPAQREADALAGIASFYLEQHAAVADRGVSPHVLIHVPLARFEAHQHARRFEVAWPDRSNSSDWALGRELSLLPPNPFTQPLFTRDGRLLTPTAADAALREQRFADPARRGLQPWDMSPAPPLPEPCHLRLVTDTDSWPPDTPSRDPDPPDWAMQLDQPAVSARPEIVPVATYADGRPVTEHDLDLALCDARLTRVVLDSDSMPLDLGRTARTYTWQQTQAALIRYAGVCATTGCGAPAAHLRMHHPTPWSEGGKTDNDAVPLCQHHHARLHHGNPLQLTTGATLGPHGWITQAAA